MNPIILLITANILIVVSTTILQFVAISNLNSQLILGISNLLSALIFVAFLRPKSKADSGSINGKPQLFVMALRVISYFCVYGIFIGFPKVIPLSAILSIQTLTPFIAMITLSAVLPTKFPFKLTKMDFLKIAFLGLIALNQVDNRSTDSTMSKPMLFFGIAFFSIINQLSAKYLSKTTAIVWNAGYYTLFCGISFLALALIKGQALSLSSGAIMWTIFLTASILLTQILFIKGLASTSSISSSIGMSTIVPISLVGQKLLGQNELSLFTFVLICTFLIILTFDLYLKSIAALESNTEIPH